MHEYKAVEVVKSLLKACIDSKVELCSDVKFRERCRDRDRFVSDVILCLYDTVTDFIAELCKVIDSKYFSILEDVERAYRELENKLK